MNAYRELSDEYYVNMHLNTEMELSSDRETLLHFFDQLRKLYPSMRNFYNRDRQELILEEDRERPGYRWASLEPRRVCSGYVNPPAVEDALAQHRQVLECVPYLLSISGLDCESLTLVYGFDFTYRGNHNQLLAEALGLIPAFDRISFHPELVLTGYEPALQFSLDRSCRTHCRISFETRTTAQHIKTGEYPDEQLSVYVAVRRFGSLDTSEQFVDVLEALAAWGNEVLDNYVVDSILRPLYETIARQ
ncbi:MAG: hypothetical protein KatS3mg110_0402 [Pirellulaceae bacterium]|nr:MAG: hypothetical protein KatS3mg110_0402 [Pirellulaceae bacterium]